MTRIMGRRPYLSIGQVDNGATTIPATLRIAFELAQPALSTHLPTERHAEGLISTRLSDRDYQIG